MRSEDSSALSAVQCLGIDIGGSGIKGAIVDTRLGTIVSERVRRKTPSPASPRSVTQRVVELVRGFSWKGPIGCGFPGVVRQGRVLTAANVSNKWLSVEAEAMLSEATGNSVVLANDADLAGLAEARFGAGVGVRGFQILLTLGTGVGSALLYDQKLIPNTELGHLHVGKNEVDGWASVRAKKREGLSWKKWAKRLDKTLAVYHDILWPERFILGGGIIKKQDKFIPLLNPPCPIVPAMLENDAGIIGAALAASEGLRV